MPDDTPTPPEPTQAPAAAPDPAPEQDSDTITLTRAEADALKRQAKEGRDARKQAEKAERERAERDGEYQSLAEKERERADKAESDLSDMRAREVIQSVARRLNFRNPAVAARLLDPDDKTDEKSIESALKRWAREDATLTTATSRSGGPIDTPSSTGGDMNSLIRRTAGR